MPAFRSTSGPKGFKRCKVRLAKKSGLITRSPERRSEPALPQRRLKVDAVIEHAVGQRQHARKDRCARGLAHDIRRNAGIEACAITCQGFYMGRFHAAAVKATEAVGALHVRRD